MHKVNSLANKINTKWAAEYISSQIADLCEQFCSDNKEEYESLTEEEQDLLHKEFYEQLIERL